MNLETLALIGEFVGGIAVIVTIVYLAYQTRQTRLLLEQSNQQQAASMLRANIDGWNREKIAFSPQFGMAVDRVLSLEDAAAHGAIKSCSEGRQDG